MAGMLFQSVLQCQEDPPCLNCNLTALLQLNNNLQLPSDVRLIECDLIFCQGKVVEERLSFLHRQARPLFRLCK